MLSTHLFLVPGGILILNITVIAVLLDQLCDSIAFLRCVPLSEIMGSFKTEVYFKKYFRNTRVQTVELDLI